VLRTEEQLRRRGSTIDVELIHIGYRLLLIVSCGSHHSLSVCVLSLIRPSDRTAPSPSVLSFQGEEGHPNPLCQRVVQVTSLLFFCIRSTFSIMSVLYHSSTLFGYNFPVDFTCSVWTIFLLENKPWLFGVRILFLIRVRSLFFVCCEDDEIYALSF